jgi:uncharacterized membrane protein HdeD (DUF308 family)
MATEDQSTMDLLRGSRITAYSLGLVSLVAGIVLLAWPSRTEHVVAVVLGILFVVTGFGQAAEAVTTHRAGSYWGLMLLRGVINLGIGLALIFWSSATFTTIVWLVGLNFVITGVLGLIVSFMLPKEMGRGSLLVQSVITIALGIVVMAWPNSIKYAAAVVIGLVLVVLGLMFLFSGYQLSKAKAVIVRS